MGEMTPAREKVVKGLECCIKHDPEDLPKCDICTYTDACLNRLKIDALALLRRPPAVWQYYTNDEGKARWKCSECGKVCRRDPRDKKFCSACGAEMRMEA